MTTATIIIAAAVIASVIGTVLEAFRYYKERTS